MVIIGNIMRLMITYLMRGSYRRSRRANAGGNCVYDQREYGERRCRDGQHDDGDQCDQYGKSCRICNYSNSSPFHCTATSAVSNNRVRYPDCLLSGNLLMEEIFLPLQRILKVNGVGVPSSRTFKVLPIAIIINLYDRYNR